MKPNFLRNFVIPIPYKQIYSRLGYRKSSTEISPEQEKKINSVINESFLLCKLDASFVRLNITKKSDVSVEIDDFRVESRDFAKFLIDSNETYLLCCTVGNEIVSRRNALTNEDGFKSVIYDAVGSETVESFTERINEYLGKIIVKEGKTLTKRRYSPGYGDFSLVYQKKIAEILEIDKLGVSVSDSFILNPEKSVTAFIGIL